MRDFYSNEIDKINSLSNNNSFQVFKEWVKDSLHLEREESDRLDEFGEMKKSQGYRCALDDILCDLNELEIDLRERDK